MLSKIRITVNMVLISISSSIGLKDTYISNDIQNYCVEIGNQYNICPELIMAIVEKESAGKSDAVNGNCKGLMQVNPYCHKERMEELGVTNIFDEYGNILVGVDYLAELAGEYEDLCYVLDVYNGNSKAEANFESGTVSTYAEWILSRSMELERKHGK